MNQTINIAEQVPMVPEQIIGWMLTLFGVFIFVFVGYILYKFLE